MGFLKVLRTVVKGIALLDSVLDEIEREKAQENAKKATQGQKVSEAYQKASNGPFHR